MTWWDRLLDRTFPVFLGIYAVALIGAVSVLWVGAIYLTFASGTAAGVRVLTAIGAVFGAAFLVLVGISFVDSRRRRERELEALKERAAAFEAFYHLTIADEGEMSPGQAEAVMDRIDRILRPE